MSATSTQKVRNEMLQSELTKTVDSYIIGVIDGEEYEHEGPISCPREKLQFLRKVFFDEMQWEIDRNGEKAAMKMWLQGMPSVLDIAIYHGDIRMLAVEWSIMPLLHTEEQGMAAVDEYWSLLTERTLVLIAPVERLV